MVAPRSTRRTVPLALQLASLPPIIIASPANEKHQVPCIMITPSSPIRERNVQFDYFESEKLAPGVFRPIRHPACPSTGGIPLSGPYYDPSERNGWSASKRFRFILMLCACIFFALHLLALPRMETGLYDVLSSGHSSSPIYDQVDATMAAALEETVPLEMVSVTDAVLETETPSPVPVAPDASPVDVVPSTIAV